MCAAAWKTISGRIPAEHRVDHRRVADVGEHHFRLGDALQAVHRVVEVRLVVVEQHQRSGPNSATWRAISEPIHPPPPVTSTRRPCEELPHRLEVDGDLLAAEEVLDVEVAHLRGAGACRAPTTTTRGSTRTGIARGLGGVGHLLRRLAAVPTASRSRIRWTS